MTGGRAWVRSREMSDLAIDARGLTKNYKGARGITNVDLEVHRGESYGFLGPNGAGKTTFIRLCLGLLHAQSGSVAIFGHDVMVDRSRALAEIGYLPGELSLYGSLSGTATLDMLSRLHPRSPVRRHELLEVLGLTRADMRRPVRQYSRGMKQKLGLVAALEHDPPLAILDEPTGGLDPVVQLQLTDWLRERVHAGMTLFFSSHILSEVESLCDRVAMIRDGELLLVRDVNDLNLSSMRIVKMRFGSPTDPSAYSSRHISDIRVEGTLHECTLQGSPAALIDALTRCEIEELTMVPLSLEDAFRALYVPNSGEST